MKPCSGSKTKEYSRKIATSGKRHKGHCKQCNRWVDLTKDNKMFKHLDD